MGSSQSAPSPFKESGNKLFGERRFDEAIEAYSRGLQLEKMNSQLYSNRSAAYAETGRYRLALLDALAAAAIQPDWGKAYCRIGKAFALQNAFREALAAYAVADELEPGNASIKQMISEVTEKARSVPSCDPALTGHLMCWGANDKGACGTGDRKDRSGPRGVLWLGTPPSKVLDISCGLAHTVIIAHGICGGATQAWSWGGNSHGQCGVGVRGDDILAPRLIKGLLGKNPVAVACGAGHNVVLTESGSAYSFGVGGYGSLGLGDGTREALVPTRMGARAVLGVKLVGVACGIGHTILTDDKGVTFAVGWNKHGQCGMGPAATESLFEVHPVPKLHGENVRHVACGGAHTLYVLDSGAVLACGSNSCGQLGMGDNCDRLAPEPIPSLSGSHSAMAGCGEEFSVVVTADRRVFAFGLNNVGQLGCGDTTNRSVPCEVDPLRSLRIGLLACGQGEAVALTEDGRVYSWGMKGTDARMAQAQGAASFAQPSPRHWASLQKSRRLECGRNHYCLLNDVTSPSCCRLSGDGISSAKAGGTAKFAIVSGHSTDQFQVAVFDAHERYIAPELIKLAVDNNLDGSYSVSYRPLHAGELTITVMLGTVHVADSPYTVQVVAGKADARFCRLFVAGSAGLDLPRVSESVAGEVVSWGLEVCDERRCRTTCDSASLRAHVTDGRTPVSVAIASDEMDATIALASCTARSSAERLRCAANLMRPHHGMHPRALAHRGKDAQV